MFVSGFTPNLSKASLIREIHAFTSEVQLFACTIATRLPSGVVTRSICGYTFSSAFSRTTIPNIEVPADTFPVRCLTLFVATIPVPASPSGGQSGIPASNCPETSKRRAPSTVNTPAFSPARRTLGKICSSVHGRFLSAISASKICSFSAS